MSLRHCVVASFRPTIHSSLRWWSVRLTSASSPATQASGALQGRVDAAVCRAVFDQYFGTYVGGPNEAARPRVRFQNVGEKKVLKAMDRMWELELGYPKWSQRLCLNKEDAVPEKAIGPPRAMATAT